MLTEVRWEKEKELMQSVFPQFKPFMRNSVFGFEGLLKGKASGRTYHVVLESEKSSYPQFPPSIYMDPPIGHHWIGNGRRWLCVSRKWAAARSTFANSLLAAVRYLDEYDTADHAPDRRPQRGRWPSLMTGAER